MFSHSWLVPAQHVTQSRARTKLFWLSLQRTSSLQSGSRPAAVSPLGLILSSCEAMNSWILGSLVHSMRL